MKIKYRKPSIWFCKDKYEVEVAEITKDFIVLKPIDPTMARHLGIELDTEGFIVVERTICASR